MPPQHEPTQKTLRPSLDDPGLYPPAALEFMEEGLHHTMQMIHAAEKDPNASRHVSGRQLCEGLRELALQKWGMLARTVLWRWNITSTLDFGRIVFSLIDAGQMQKTDEDTLEDFRNVYDFRRAFETSYQIPAAS